MTKVQKNIGLISLVIFLLPEIVWGTTLNLLYGFFAGGDPVKVFRDSWILEQPSIYRFVLIVQSISLWVIALTLFKTKKNLGLYLLLISTIIIALSVSLLTWFVISFNPQIL